MRKQWLVLIAVGVGLVLVPASGAWSTSSFTVKNDSNRTVQVWDYDGGDGLCAIYYQIKTIDSGDSASMSCASDGKNLCKAVVYVPDYKDYGCTNENITSSCWASSVVEVGNGKTLVIDKDYHSCSVED